MLMNYADGVIADLQNEVNQLKEQNTYLDKVTSELQDLCDRQASMLGKRDAVLDQVLELLGPQAPECSGCAAEWNLAIAAIKEARGGQ